MLIKNLNSNEKIITITKLEETYFGIYYFLSGINKDKRLSFLALIPKNIKIGTILKNFSETFDNYNNTTFFQNYFLEKRYVDYETYTVDTYPNNGFFNENFALISFSLKTNLESLPLNQLAFLTIKDLKPIAIEEKIKNAKKLIYNFVK